MLSKKDVIQVLQQRDNVLLLFATQEEALLAEIEFRKMKPHEVENTANKAILRTVTGNKIFFKSIKQINRKTDGINARVIICMPILEFISRHCGKDVCTIKQFREQEGL